MKTQEQKLQHVMEAAEECYHEQQLITGIDYEQYECKHCNVYMYLGLEGFGCPVFNPSPDDLNELFRLAEKLEFGVRTDSQEGYKCATVYDGVAAWIKSHPFNLTEALLNALFIAAGGIES